MFSNIFLTSSSIIPNNFNVIYNNSKFKYGSKYFIIFTNVSILKSFKKILDNYDIIIIYVKNYEYFYYIFKEYRFIKYNILEEEYKDRKEEYRRVENNIRDTYKRKKDDNRGIELSFNPPMYDIIRTSLLHPKLYYNKENILSSIARELKHGKKTYKELRNKIKKNIDKELKMLIFTKVVEQRNNYFYFKL